MMAGMVGWCDGTGYTASAGASYNSDYSKARAFFPCKRCGWGCLDILLSSISLGDGPI